MSITLSNLKALGRWPEALELAIQTKPEEVECLLPKAGNTYLIRGEYQRLHDQLAYLKPEYQNKPETLFWLFRTAFRLRKEKDYLSQVVDLLSHQEGPNLRALYATYFLEASTRQAELKRAKEHDPNFFVRHHYALGRVKDDPDEAIQELENLCSSAQIEGHSFDFLQSLDLLGYCYAQQGKFKKTHDCITRAHAIFLKEAQYDWQLYLSSCNNLLQNQMVINEFSNDKSLVDVLSSNHQKLQSYLEFEFRATLGDYWLAKDDVQKALSYHKQNFDLYQTLSETNSLYPDTLVFNYLKLLLATNEMPLAHEILNAYRQSSKALSPGTILAECLLNSPKEPDSILNLLEHIETKSLSIELQIIKLALQADSYLRNDNLAKASDLLKAKPIHDLSLEAFRVFLGTTRFDHIYHFWQGNDLLPIIRDPKAFEELANDEVTWQRLALLKDFPGELEQVRYAQYLSSQNYFSEANTALIPFLQETPSPLVLGTYMSNLLASGDIKTFENLLNYDVVAGSSPLHTEGRIKIYEAIAGYLYTHKNEPKLAQKNLIWEEALAKELDLARRLRIINMLLEEVNSALGESITLEPLNLKGLKTTLQKQHRQRFDSILHQTNILAAQMLLHENHIKQDDLNLVIALKLYRDAEQGQARFVACLNHLGKDLPEHSESKLYYALLSLQLYAKLGPSFSMINLRNTVTLLEEASQEIVNLDLLFPLTARTFPLGLALASHLSERFVPSRTFVSIVINSDEDGGIYRGSEKVASLPPQVREALLNDGLNASDTAFESAISSKTGYTANKTRFTKALKTANRERFEMTNAGAIYRGLSFCYQDTLFKEVAQNAFKEAYLQSVVNIL